MNDKIDYFDEIWNRKKSDPSASKILWDNRAREFNKHRHNERVNQIVDFLISRQTLDKNAEVLDIGCGTGKYSLEFAKRAKKVVGLDISTNMIEFAEKNALKENLTNTEFMVLPWEDADIEALGWKKKFKLVAAIMTPAINSRTCLDKMIEACDGYCIMSGHLDKREKVKDEIEKNVLDREPSTIDYGRNIYCSFNVLWQYGIYPELTYYDMKSEKVRTVEEAFGYYCSQLQRKYEINEEEKLDIKEYLNKISQNGQVKDIFESKTAWLFWKIK